MIILLTALTIFGIFSLALLGYFGLLLAVWATVLMLRDSILSLGTAIFGARQLQIDHEQARSELDLNQQKNELLVEEARQKLHINRQRMIQEVINE